MNNVLILCEKNAMAKDLMRAVPELTDSDVVSFYGLGFFEYDYPRHLPISSRPIIIPVKYKIKEARHIFNSNLAIDYRSLIKEYRSKLNDYNEILIVCDMDNRGIYFSQLSITELLIDSGFTGKVTILGSVSFDKETLRMSWENRTVYVFDNEIFQRAKAKYYFDWLWNINSAPVFGKALAMAGAKSDLIFSKYELMTFHCIYNELPHSNMDVYIFSFLQDYKGTGKYFSDCKEDRYESPSVFEGIASPSSRSAILEQLLNRGLIQKVNDHYAVTDAGRKFYELLHKRSFDPDLPFRIQVWSFDNDYEAMESYISKYFSRQKRFNAT
ncbi:hypothetical protein BS054_19405 [Vibrio parahaemolyticus]|nr:hypothetical protein [Vibrio parahaemolyticus]